jgi:SAM-dependent methyltransferase
MLSGRIPAGAEVVDIGCGSGEISSHLKNTNPKLSVRGFEVYVRPNCAIPCEAFDGSSIPIENSSADVSMLVDVLHHTSDAEHLLADARRVSREFVLIKDVISENMFDYIILRFMDWIGNRSYGLKLVCIYKNRREWNEVFSSTQLEVIEWEDDLPLYPKPLDRLFVRKMHFIALLRKTSTDGRISG